VPALGDLGAQLALQPLGLALALGLAADLALAAGHRVDAGVDDDLVAVAAPPDHACSPSDRSSSG
jgi:hypothetical protein